MALEELVACNTSSEFSDWKDEDLLAAEKMLAFLYFTEEQVFQLNLEITNRGIAKWL